MKGKVFNRVFWDASYSFVVLEQYYSHMVALLHQSADDSLSFIEELRVEYTRGGRDFDERRWQRHHQVYGKVYPALFHNSFLLSACSLFEYNAKEVAAFVEKEHKMPLDWDTMEGTVPRKTRRYLQLAGVELGDQDSEFPLMTSLSGKRTMTAAALWRAIRSYFVVRNCIAHHNGVVGKDANTEGIREYATSKRVLSNDTAGQSKLMLTEEFNREACQTMREFFQRLMCAYYGVPLPD